jgi:pSer/pThr/pTyr-binding forkhead associated (FHA) protein
VAESEQLEAELSRGVLRLAIDTGSLRVGRSTECELFLPDISVSEVHATLYEEGGNFYLRDETSLNRTYAGGLALRADVPRRLCGPQKLRFGRVHVLFNLRKKVVELAEGQTANVALALAKDALAGDDSRATFVVVQGESMGKRIQVGYGATVVVGRSPSAHLVLTDASVSAVHLEIRRAEHGFFVRDRGSTHGTLLGGKRLSEDEWSLIDPGQTIGLGLAALTFEARPDSAELSAEEESDELDAGQPPPFESLRPPVHDGLTMPPPPPAPDPKSPPPSIPPPSEAELLEHAQMLQQMHAVQLARQRRDVRNFWVMLCIFAVLVGFAVAGTVWVLLP